MSLHTLRIIVYFCVTVFLFSITNIIGAATTESTKQRNPELSKMMSMLDCTCECGLSLAHCVKEDSDCSVRPGLVKKLNHLADDGKRGMELILAFMGPVHPVKELLMEARLHDRHAILFFSQRGSRECDDVETVLKEGAKIWGDRVRIAQMDINKKENKSIKEEYRIFSTPTVLLIAPNGVVTREFKKKITVAQIEGAFVTPAMAEILRGLQDKRVIFLTVNAPDWKNATSVKRTVSMGGEILRNAVRIVHVDPTDTKERSFLKMLKLEKDRNESLTYVVSQSGTIGSKLEGTVSKKDLFMAFQKVLASRSGCGGSGSGVGGNTCQ